MPTIGQRLREERIRQGKQIRPIADELRIGTRYLEAIEAEEWEKLPGEFFNRSFVRQYAGWLGLDSHSFESEYVATQGKGKNTASDPRAQLETQGSFISLAPVTVRSSSFFDRRTGLAIAALLLLVAGGGAISLLWDSWQVPQRNSVAANRISVPEPIVPAPAAAADPQAEADSASPVKQEPQSTPSVAASVTPDGVMSLNISATEKTWLELTADGKRIFVGVLNPGDTQTVSTAQQARMLVGNAGGITVQKAGRDIGPIGPRGQVRVVKVTKDDVEISQPPQAAPVGARNSSGEV